jgi:ribosomal protein S18 acetylase RimI-like enzyme
VWAPK